MKPCQRPSRPLAAAAAALAALAGAAGALAQTSASDRCAAAPLLPPVTTTPHFVGGDTASIGATQDPMPDCVIPLDANNAFFRFAGTGNTVTISTCTAVNINAFAQYDAAISVYCGPCSAAQCVTGSDDSCSLGTGATVRFCTDPNQEYIVMVHGAAAGEIGLFSAVVFDDGTACADPAPCGGGGGGDCPNIVDFESRATGESWGSAAGTVPGATIFTENGVPVSVKQFLFGGGGGAFNAATIVPAPAGCLDGKAMALNNINAGFDYSGFPTPTTSVTFEYEDLGGFENLSINGSPMYIGELDLAPAVIGGVGVSVTSIGPNCWEVVLTGAVSEFCVGGQEFTLDNVCPRFGPGGDDCDNEVDFESRVIGESWGGALGDLPGDLIFTENGVPVRVDEFTLGAFTGFSLARIEPAPMVCTRLMGKTMSLNNISTVYDFSGLGMPVASVTFDYLDLGGDENLQVNGAPRHEIPNFASLPPMVAPGVAASDSFAPVLGGRCGTVTLTGDVQRLLIGGQELWIDNICVTLRRPPPCPTGGVNAESRPLGETFNAPGPMFVENGIPVVAKELMLAPGPFFNFAQIDPAFPTCLHSQVIETNNVALGFGISALGRVPAAVEFDWLDQGGTENLEVNGAGVFIGDIENAPNAIAPGVVYTRSFVDTADGRCGHGVLTGPVSRFCVGGQEFWVDNVCVIFPACPCEWDGDTAQVDVFDLLKYLDIWFVQSGSNVPPGTGADTDGNGTVDVFDLLNYLDCWFPASAGNPCP